MLSQTTAARADPREACTIDTTRIGNPRAMITKAVPRRLPCATAGPARMPGMENDSAEVANATTASAPENQ